MTRNWSRRAASWGAHMLRLKGWPWMSTTAGPSPTSSWARSTVAMGPMLSADVSLEPGDRTSGLDRRGLLANVGAGARRHIGLHAKDIACYVTEHLRDADPGTRRVALLTAEREALRVRREPARQPHQGGVLPVEDRDVDDGFGRRRVEHLAGDNGHGQLRGWL